VARVLVSVAKLGREGKDFDCRFLSAGGGRLTRFRECSKRALSKARGTKSWRASFGFPIRLPRGEWRVWVQAIDGSGNRERASNFFTLTVR
jgi:hypothetical protein